MVLYVEKYFLFFSGIVKSIIIYIIYILYLNLLYSMYILLQCGMFIKSLLTELFEIHLQL